jgi:hypothetical protein
MNLPDFKPIIFAGKSNWAREMENTTDADLIYVARNGHILGRYYEEGILKGFDCGFFLPTDLGWDQGLAAWLLLTEIVHVPTTSSAAVADLAYPTTDEVQSGEMLDFPPEQGQELLMTLDEYLAAVHA